MKKIKYEKLLIKSIILNKLRVIDSLQEICFHKIFGSISDGINYCDMNINSIIFNSHLLNVSSIKF